MPDYEIAEIIHISYKVGKRIESSQLVLQIKYFTYVTRIKGFPAGFTSLRNSSKNFVGFCTAINNFWIDTFSYYDSVYNTSFEKINYELKVQGSVTRKRKMLPEPDPLVDNVDPTMFIGLDTPGDIEYAMLMDEVNFNAYINNLKALVKKLIKDKDESNSAISQLSSALSNKNLKSTFFARVPKENETLLSIMRSAGLPHTTFTKNKINFSVIQKGSRLDLGPYIEFKY